MTVTKWAAVGLVSLALGACGESEPGADDVGRKATPLEKDTAQAIKACGGIHRVQSMHAMGSSDGTEYAWSCVPAGVRVKK